MILTLSCILALAALGCALWALVKGEAPRLATAALLLALVELFHCIPVGR